jgi:purine-binding chemotaxis protein CheW
MANDRNEKTGRVIDWREIYQRLENAGAELDRRLTPGSEEKNILHARAVALARDSIQVAFDGTQIEVLEFMLSDETYAIETVYVHEVLPLKELAPLPGIPSFVLGIINLRGQILSVVDLKEFFGLSFKGLTELNKVIILQSADIEFGLLVDSVIGMRVFAASELEQAIPTITGIGAEYLKGVTRDHLIVLAADKILSDSRMKIYEEVE